MVRMISTVDACVYHNGVMYLSAQRDIMLIFVYLQRESEYMYVNNCYNLSIPLSPIDNNDLLYPHTCAHLIINVLKPLYF